MFSYIQVQQLRKQAAISEPRLVLPTVPKEPVLTLPPVPKAKQPVDDMQRFYNAVQFAETGSFKNPWIRATTAGKEGSSAYGPVQITQKKALDYLDRFPKAMASSSAFYKNTLGPMHANFLEYGREPNKPGYDPKWDYGGYGKVLTPAEKAAYRNMGLNMMRIDADEARRLLPKGTPEELLRKRIELWRGKQYKDDKAYFDRLIDYYNRH